LPVAVAAETIRMPACSLRFHWDSAAAATLPEKAANSAAMTQASAATERVSGAKLENPTT
jgi:hypothetical protein